MATELLMGNAIIGLSALAAGVGLVAGYPGTPSTEILETVAANNPDGKVHVEWSTNEKAAFEVAAGASYAGVRCMVTCKQVGLNVAADPLMSLNYVGVKGGYVVVCADDPGPISSQTEQDTRRFGSFSKIPVLDPATPEECLELVPYAFELSERYATPVIVRPTTRICHAYTGVERPVPVPPAQPEGFDYDPKWVIFPPRALRGHHEINDRLPRIAADFATHPLNTVTHLGQGPAACVVFTGGVSHGYALEALSNPQVRGDNAVDVVHIATPFPFPDDFATQALADARDVLVLEELDSVIEDDLLRIAGARHLPVTVHGKRTHEAKDAGENSVESAARDIAAFLGTPAQAARNAQQPDAPQLPVRPPVLCAGCPHRSSFYAVKQALRGKKVAYAGDIGCYTLGNAAPLNTTDTCLCMGAGITVAQGAHIAEPDAVNVAFVGDSTFFASGITGVVNAVYNQNQLLLVVLDNSTTAMTGMQPHPGTGLTMMGVKHDPISISAVLKAIGLSCVVEANPHDNAAAIAAVKQAAAAGGVSAVIFKAPCTHLVKPAPSAVVDPQLCTGCRTCIKQLGCPAFIWRDGKLVIDPGLCWGCTLCEQVCPFDAISHQEVADK